MEDIYISTTSGIGILLAVYAALQTRDYLGIRSEMLVLLVFGLLSFIVWVILTLTVTGNDKRVFYFLGFALMSSGFCIISIYFPFFRHGMYQRIQNFKRDPSHSYTNDKELLNIFANKTHFDEFRKFTGNVMCTENVDFIVAISQWRYEVLQAINQKPGFLKYLY